MTKPGVAENAITEHAVKFAEATITNQALADWQQRIGVELRIGNIFNQTASREAIRNFANGIGDNNPLFRDEEYAQKTRYKSLIASPGWIHSTAPWVLQGLPGIHGFHAGSDITFHKPVYAGDYITPKCEFLGYDLRPSAFSGKTVMEYQRMSYTNQRGELVTELVLWEVRAERQNARKEGKYSKIQLPHPWTKEELDKIDEEVLGEDIRGANTRYWEEVAGDELHPLVKGPFGLTDMIAYCVGAAPVTIAAHATQLKLYKDHPAWAFRDPVSCAWEPVYGVHYNIAAANAAGVPYTYDVGVQRHSWLINFLTHWIGDEGWLKRCYAEYRKFVYFSDVLWFRGKVTRKYVEAGEYCLDVETSAVNQRGENTMPGRSTIVLSSKANGTSPVEKRRR